MMNESMEDYLGAIYRLRSDRETPLPLSQLQEFFEFSRVSVHEMIQKMARQELVIYHPYYGVTLTDTGEKAALALLRRHRLWERFLTDMLAVPWDEAHKIACRLEHAASEKVTERLAGLLGEPQECPHGGPIPPTESLQRGEPLNHFKGGAECFILRIAPERPHVLRRLHELGLGPGSKIHVINQTPTGTQVKIGKDHQPIHLPMEISATVWVDTH
ncbi:MAG: metal-dependent transcriptional regulator [Anaerolineae bacterium]|nr:metal-dependent transcriptional regulator [Anaerolineae bacterium]